MAKFEEKSNKSVFVGNIPYEATEEQLREIFQQVGPVSSFRIVYDRETGKPKGYGFCEYQDVETAQSAMRNLNDFEYHGRTLRVSHAAGDQAGMAGLVGPQEDHPYGDPVDPEKAPESISKAVASLPPEQMFELMKQMKLCIQNNPNEARNMLLQNPQLAYALLQAQIVMKIVDPQVALAMLHRQTEQIPPLIPSPSSAPAPQQLPQTSQNVGMSPHDVDHRQMAYSAPPSMPNPAVPMNTMGAGEMGAPMPGPKVESGFPRGPGPNMRPEYPGPAVGPLPGGPPRSGLLGDRPPSIDDYDQHAVGAYPQRNEPLLRAPMHPGGPPRPVQGYGGPPAGVRPSGPYSGGPPSARAAPDPRDPRSQRMPTAAPAPAPTRPQAAQPAMSPQDQEKAALIMQVLQLTDQQIAMLPPDQRQSILILKEQIARSSIS